MQSSWLFHNWEDLKTARVIVNRGKEVFSIVAEHQVLEKNCCTTMPSGLKEVNTQWYRCRATRYNMTQYHRVTSRLVVGVIPSLTFSNFDLQREKRHRTNKNIHMWVWIWLCNSSSTLGWPHFSTAVISPGRIHMLDTYRTILYPHVLCRLPGNPRT